MAIRFKQPEITISKAELVSLIAERYRDSFRDDPDNAYANFEPDAGTLTTNEGQRGEFESITIKLKSKV